MKSFFLGIFGLLFFVGGGSLWFFYSLFKRKNLAKNLLSLPKERRFFWYKLKEEGYLIESINLIKKLCIHINDNKDVRLLKLDFLDRKDKKKWGGLFVDNQLDEKEAIKIFFIYSSVFDIDGIIFYNGENNILKVEL